jgi:Condensin II complex subunit CAP-H2 or CNDH2, N-terminal
VWGWRGAWKGRARGLTYGRGWRVRAESITISFDGGRTNLNFTEAALLIQGSTAAYSRKVEHLYTLIYRTLELLASKRANKKRQPQKGSLQMVDGRLVDEDVEAEAEEQFLLLDHLVPEGRDIELKEDAETFRAIATVTAGGLLPPGTPSHVAAAMHQDLLSKYGPEGGGGVGVVG